jgi:hypothetical protein
LLVHRWRFQMKHSGTRGATMIASPDTTSV